MFGKRTKKSTEPEEIEASVISAQDFDNVDVGDPTLRNIPPLEPERGLEPSPAPIPPQPPRPVPQPKFVGPTKEEMELMVDALLTTEDCQLFLKVSKGQDQYELAEKLSKWLESKK